MTLAAEAVVSGDSVSLVIREEDFGASVATGSAPLSSGEAVEETFERIWFDLGSPLVDVLRITGNGDELVLLDARGDLIHPALAWSEIDTAPDASWLGKQLPAGADEWRGATGVEPSAGMAIAQLSWLHRSEPESWARLAHVVRAHDLLVARLAGLAAADAVTDAESAAATGYWSTSSGEYRWDLLAIVDRERDWQRAVPRVVAHGEVVGEWNGVRVVVGSVG